MGAYLSPGRLIGNLWYGLIRRNSGVWKESGSAENQDYPHTVVLQYSTEFTVVLIVEEIQPQFFQILLFTILLFQILPFLYSWDRRPFEEHM